MHHFETVSKNLRAPSLQPHIRRARDIYEENLRMYIRLVLRRPLARLLVSNICQTSNVCSSLWLIGLLRRRGETAEGNSGKRDQSSLGIQQVVSQESSRQHERERFAQSSRSLIQKSREAFHRHYQSICRKC